LFQNFLEFYDSCFVICDLGLGAVGRALKGSFATTRSCKRRSLVDFSSQNYCN